MNEIINNRKTASNLLLIEALITLTSALLLFLFASPVLAYSVALGGVAFILPNCLFVWLSLRQVRVNSEKNMLAWFYLGEAVKIVSTIGIFAGCMLLVSPLNIGLMFVSYGLMLLINLTGLALTMNK